MVTLNHLAATFLVFLFFFGGENSQTEGLRTISATGCCLQCSKPWSFSWVKVNNYPVIKKTGQFHSGFLGSPFVRVPRSHCSTSNISVIFEVFHPPGIFIALTQTFFDFLVTKKLTFDKDRSQKTIKNSHPKHWKSVTEGWWIWLPPKIWGPVVLDLAILCNLFGMVKWPFSMVKWPPTRGWKGHNDLPGK